MALINASNNCASLRDSCLSRETLEQYLSIKANNHNYFKLYTTIERLTDIVTSRQLLLSDGDCWNDLCDKEQLNRANYRRQYFAKCFSFSVSENVAMWMLYGGLRKGGAILNLCRSDMRRMVEARKIDLYEISENNEYKYVQALNDSESEIWLTDVLYFGDDAKGQMTIKRSDERVKLEDRTILTQSGEDGDVRPYFKKIYPWGFENEVRLVVSIPKEMLEVGKRYGVKMHMEIDSERLKESIILSEKQQQFPDYRVSNLRYQMNSDYLSS